MVPGGGGDLSRKGTRDYHSKEKYSSTVHFSRWSAVHFLVTKYCTVPAQ